MPAPRNPVVVAALATVVVVGAVAHHLVRTRRALDAERAARRITAGMQARDLEAFAVRINRLTGARAVLTEADLILDTALAAHHSNPEGGPQ